MGRYTIAAMKKYLLLTGLLLLLSCSDGGDDICCMTITDTFTVILKDKEGKDLLNPASPHCIVPDSIKLFYVVNNTEYEIYNPKSDSPRNFIVYKNMSDDLFRIQIYANHSPEEAFPITYIQWNPHDRDTIKCEFETKPNSILLKKLWYNNVLRIDMEQDSTTEFEVIKTQ